MNKPGMWNPEPGVRMAALVAAVLATASCGFKHAKYENPITKDTQQPDKVLFDKAIHDIEHGRYEVARLTLNTDRKSTRLNSSHVEISYAVFCLKKKKKKKKKKNTQTKTKCRKNKI